MRALRAVVALASVGVAGCLAVFGTWLTAGLCLLPAIGAWRGRWAVALLGGFAVVPAPVEYLLRVQTLAAHRDALSTREKAGIWLLNLGMAAGGTLAGFPEVALETTLLTIPDRDGVRTFRSSFPRGSSAIAPVIDGWHRACAAGQRAFGPTRLGLGYGGGHADVRRALALAPPTLTATADDACALSVTVSVPIDYPEQAFLRLFDTPLGTVGVDEGLYDALEDAGWLFPYEARWVWAEPAPGG